MTKQRKKLWSMLLAIVMVLTTVFANTNAAAVAKAAEKITVDAEQVEAGQTIVHFKPTSMKTPYIWAYNDSKGENYSGGAWPGKAMTDEGNGWYSYTIEADSASVIFSDNGGSQEPASQQPGYTMSGEVWYVQGNGGKTTPTNPDGDKPTTTPTNSTKPSETTKPSQTPTAPVESEKPSNGIITIDTVTPGDEQLKVNEKVTLKTEVTLDKTIDYAYYKYEVTYNGKYVGDHYYSKNAEYSFTPEKVGTYTVKVYAQAHDMENTTVQENITYEVVDTSELNTATPVVTTIVAPSAPTETQVPGESKAPAETQKPATSETPSPTKPSAGSNKTEEPNVTPSVTPTTTVSAAPSVAPTAGVPTPTVNEVKSVKITLSRKTPQYRGRTVKILAKVEGGSNLEYTFKLENVKTGNVKVLKEDSEKNYVNWTPGKNDIGTFKFHVYVYQDGVVVKNASSGKFTIKNKKLSIDKIVVSKKSKYYAIAANTAGGYGTIKYRYIVKNLKGKVKFRTAYSTTRVAAWKAKKGTYKVYAYVKDSKIKKAKVLKVKIK